MDLECFECFGCFGCGIESLFGKELLIGVRIWRGCVCEDKNEVEYWGWDVKGRLFGR